MLERARIDCGGGRKGLVVGGLRVLTCKLFARGALFVGCRGGDGGYSGIICGRVGFIRSRGGIVHRPVRSLDGLVVLVNGLVVRIPCV